MNPLHKKPDKGDPSDVLQWFPTYNIQLLCCRYWWLKNWEFSELTFPYWRIYHNDYSGASISYEGRDIELNPNKIILIAPNTFYSTRLYNNAIPAEGYNLEGGRISSKTLKLKYEQSISHLFIHFNAGMPYDSILPGIYLYEINEHLKEKLSIIKEHLNHEHTRFSIHSTLAIHSLINDLLADLPPDNWQQVTKDNRIINTLSYIEKNINTKLDNTILASNTNLVTNAFTRLFKEEMGISPQKYIRTKRIKKACIHLHHSNLSIEEVAQQTGFADRFHFSRIFKRETGISPAKYKIGFMV